MRWIVGGLVEPYQTYQDKLHVDLGENWCKRARFHALQRSVTVFRKDVHLFHLLLIAIANLCPEVTTVADCDF